MCYRPLCYGDSNTYGYNPRSYLGGRYPESVRWTAVLNTKGWEVINKGDNGRSIPKLNQEIGAAANVIHRSKAETVIVMLGSNDLLQCSDLVAEVCGKRMERFLRAVLIQMRESLRFCWLSLREYR